MVLNARVGREGIVAGLVGAATVAVWFLLFDAVQGTPLKTPAVLGQVIGAIIRFQTISEVQSVAVALTPVLGYTILHGLAFVQALGSGQVTRPHYFRQPQIENLQAPVRRDPKIAWL